MYDYIRVQLAVPHFYCMCTPIDSKVGVCLEQDVFSSYLTFFQEVSGKSLGYERNWGYIFRTTGGNNKQDSPMKQTQAQVCSWLYRRSWYLGRLPRYRQAE